MLRPTFLAFQTASRALAASQANIDVTGNNIANVETNGYSRQRVDQSSIAASGYTQKYTVRGVSIGLGVDVTGVSQIRDPFLDARYRAQSAETGRYDNLLEGLSDLENVFNEVESPGLISEISSFIEQLHNLSETPSNMDIARVVSTAAQKVTRILNAYANQIEQVRTQQIQDLSKVVVGTDFNAIVKSIADLNDQIRDELTHGNTPNELYDKRNTLIDELSSIANIKVTTYPEKVSEDLTIENLTISIYNPQTNQSIGIVNSGLYNTLHAAMNPATDRMEISIRSSFGGYYGNITDVFQGGAISGYLDMINGNGTYAANAGESTFRGTMYYKNALDTFASSFAKVLNDLNVDPVNGPQLLFTGGDGLTATDITAANIRISEAWLNNAGYLVTTTSTTTSGAADNVLRMIHALENDMDFHSADGSLKFQGTVGEYMSGLLGEISLDIELHESFAKTSNIVLNNLYAARESISGVNLDEEGIQLMAFQKSYNAAARYFNVLDEAVDKIINGMGLVGR